MAKNKRYSYHADGDRSPERMIETKSKKRFYDGDYAGLDERRAEEERDSRMLSDDHSAIANMPQDVKYHAWPKVGHYAEYDLDDTIQGIDRQMDADGAGMRKHKSRSKY